MNRRGNIQHGQERRMSWSVRAPILCLLILIPLLIWELLLFCGAI